MNPQPKLKEIEFVVCLHLQATCDENHEMKPCQEVIELSASVLSLRKQQAQLMGNFHQLVRPQCNTKLTEFCEKVTGIRSLQLKGEKNIQSVMEEFEKWVKSMQGLRVDNLTFVTWGNWSIKSGLLKEIRVKKLRVPQFVHSYIDMKRIFAFHFGENLSVHEACKYLNINENADKQLTRSQVTLENITNITAQLFNCKKFRPSRKFVTNVQDLPNVNVTDELDYLLVLDFQATCDQNVKLKPCAEIIEFPVMVVSLGEARVVAKFHHYITPSFNPKLSKFCTELTGITQEMVDGKLKLEQVLGELEKWMDSQKYLVAKNFTFVTCGDWDLAVCLPKQAKTKNIELPEYLKNYINIKDIFRQCVPEFNQSMGMMGMLQGLEIAHEGRHHSGIDDVQNICNICIGLMKKRGHKYTKQQIKYVR